MLSVKKIIVWAAAALLLITVYFMFNPSGSAMFPKCPFLVLTGLECPGCGSQRAVHSLLHLDIVSAFRYNALLVVSIPAVMVYLYAEINRKRKPALYATLHKGIVIWSIFAIVVIWWIARNLFNF